MTTMILMALMGQVEPDECVRNFNRCIIEAEYSDSLCQQARLEDLIECWSNPHRSPRWCDRQNRWWICICKAARRLSDCECVSDYEVCRGRDALDCYSMLDTSGCVYPGDDEHMQRKQRRPRREKTDRRNG